MMRLYAMYAPNGFWKVETSKGRELASGFGPVPAEYRDQIEQARITNRVISFRQDAVVGIGARR